MGAKEPRREHDDEILQNARVGYQVAANLEANEVRALWSRFNAMLTANGIIIAAIALLLNSAIGEGTPERSLALAFIALIMSAMGIPLCERWHRLMGRKQKFCSYLMISAREQESKYLRSPIQTVIRGRRLVDGEEVTIDDGERTERLKMGQWEGRKNRASWRERRKKKRRERWEIHKTADVSHSIIRCFTILYAFLIAASTWAVISSMARLWCS